MPSRAWIAARGGSVVVRDSVSPRRRPGWTRYGRQSIAVSSPSSTTGSAIRPESVPKMRVRITTGTGTASPCGSPGRPVLTAESVATPAALRYTRAKRSSGTRSRAAGVSSACIDA